MFLFLSPRISLLQIFSSHVLSSAMTAERQRRQRAQYRLSPFLRICYPFGSVSSPREARHCEHYSEDRPVRNEVSISQFANSHELLGRTTAEFQRGSRAQTRVSAIGVARGLNFCRWRTRLIFELAHQRHSNSVEVKLRIIRKICESYNIPLHVYIIVLSL